VELEVSDRLVDMARDGIDIAIRTAVALPDTAVARRIGTLGRACYASPAMARRTACPTHPGRLRQHRLIANSAATQLNHWPFSSTAGGSSCRSTASGAATTPAWWPTWCSRGWASGACPPWSAEPLVRQGGWCRCWPQFIDPQPVPIYAVTAGARQRLPKIRACIDYWADWPRQRMNEQDLSPPPALRRAGRGFLLRHGAHLVALGFGAGLSPKAPGTVGTLWAWLAFLVLQHWLGTQQLGLLIGAGTLVGWWACTITARHMGVSDPGSIVWDEVVAFWLVLWLAMPMGLVGSGRGVCPVSLL
jgi:hypothetical protein